MLLKIGNDMKNCNLRTIFVVTSLAAVSACSSSSGGDDPTPIDPAPVDVTLGDITTQTETLLASVNALPEIETADIPTTGTVNYVGLMLVGLGAGPGTQALAGQLDMTVGFTGDGSVDGTVSDFVYAEDGEADPSTILPRVDGVLTFENGDIDRTAGPDAAQFGADFSGTLNAPVEMFGIAADTDVAVNGAFGGFFYEGGIAAELGGDITPDGGAAIEIDGGLLAVER